MTDDFVESISADAIAVLLGQPPTAMPSLAIGKLFGSWFRKRAEEAREILISELQSGRRLDGDYDRDHFFSLLFQYLNAVKQGAARRNLVLLAQIVKNGCRRELEFASDEVASYANVVSTLSKDELFLLASLWRNIPDGVPPKTLDGWLDVVKNTREELVPATFTSESEMMAVASSLLRTGLITTPAVWDGNSINVTSRFYMLMRLCDLNSIS